MLLISRGIKIAESSQHKFITYFATCFIGLLIIHMTINIGMTMGLLPIIGIPLPLISKEGHPNQFFDDDRDIDEDADTYKINYVIYFNT